MIRLSLLASASWQQQGDQISLYAINGQQTVQLNPKPGRQFFQRLLHQLIQIEGKGQLPQDLPLLQPVVRKGIKKVVIILTDMYQQQNEIFDLIHQLNLPYHEILVFQIMGRKEIELDYKGTLTFEDLETGARKQINTTALKKEYQLKINQHIKALKDQLLQENVSHHLFKISEHPGEALKTFLKRRNKLI